MTTTTPPAAARTATTRTRAPWRRVVAWVPAALVLAVAVLLWPTAWGGGTTLVVVAGESMDPTFASGDLVVARAGAVEVGDVIVYRPDGVDGYVVHRVVGGDAATGWTTRGDNNGWDDVWHPTADDVAGVVRWHVAGLGAVTPVLAAPTTWIALALVVAGWLLWPARDRTVPEGADQPAQEVSVASDR
ncbi:signal peptidase I [Cellulomonas algicola]|uniref:signal peptidase I n=1 Tax=Cellulomonas algicola TaxID=2071633 RepID=UPI001C3FD7FB|nr:signal peptidase I [Cellulomonas algicola]